MSPPAAASWRGSLGPRRTVAAAGLLGAVAVWPWVASTLPEARVWADVALAALVLMPVTLAVSWVALPLAGARHVLPAAVAFAAAAWALDAAGLDGLFNAAKLATLVLFGYWFLVLFEELSWVVLVAVVIPWVDAFSVAAGPTKVVVEEHPGVFERIAIAFPLPGGDESANLGPPDIVFGSLFLAAAARFELRVAATFACTVALLGVTLAVAVALDLNGLPALPAVSLGFLAPNADLLWRRLRPAAGAHRPPSRQEGDAP
jgi:hypothetical protein